MTIPAFHDLRDRARRSLGLAQDPRRIIFIHTGVTLLFTLLLAVVNYLLEQQIGSTGGLSGIGTRSVLETVQSVLQLAQSILLPFWQIGYLYYTLKLAQGEDYGTSALTEGFRRFNAVLRLKLLTACMMLLVMIASSYAATSVFMLTPWSDPLMEALMPMMTDPEAMMDPNAMLTLYDSLPLSSIVPLMVLFVGCFLAAFIFVYYRIRMAELWLMDHPGRGAFAAIINSFKMMNRNCVATFKIDLRFWWFFVLELLITLLLYADVLLTALGIVLPFDPNVGYLICLGAYLVAQMALYLWKQNEVSVTYAHLYEALKPSEQTPI